MLRYFVKLLKLTAKMVEKKASLQNREKYKKIAKIALTH